jgi:CheY-like chemotaxis protein
MHDDGGVLLVDPDREAVLAFEEVLGDSGSVVVCTDFTDARKRLLENPPHLLVTNLRLGEYNGLHLVYLAAALGSGTQCIVYSEHHDPLLEREARSAGAAYESRQRIPDILAFDANAKLPACLEPIHRGRGYVHAPGAHAPGAHAPGPHVPGAAH